MKWNFVVLLFAVLFTHASRVHSQEVAPCPSGQMPAQVQDAVVCAPAPAGTVGPPQPVFQERWGALATDTDKGTVGFAIGKSSRELAESVAMDDCRAKRGEACAVKLSYRNACAVLAASGKNYSAATGATIESATQAAMAACSRAGGERACRVDYSACSWPVQIQ